MSLGKPSAWLKEVANASAVSLSHSRQLYYVKRRKKTQNSIVTGWQTVSSGGSGFRSSLTSRYPGIQHCSHLPMQISRRWQWWSVTKNVPSFLTPQAFCEESTATKGRKNDRVIEKQSSDGTVLVNAKVRKSAKAVYERLLCIILACAGDKYTFLYCFAKLRCLVRFIHSMITVRLFLDGNIK